MATGIIRRHAAPALALFALLATSSPAATVTTDRLDLAMNMTFLGLTVGFVSLTAAPGNDGVVSRIELETVGLAKAITGFKGEVSGTSATDGLGDLTALAFDLWYESNRETRKVVLRYDGAGTVTELETFKRGELTPSDVPEDLRNATVDPLTAFVTLRQWLGEVRDSGPDRRVVPVFDGRRRYDLDARYVGRRPSAMIDGEMVLEMELRLVPIAGFNRTDGMANWSNEDRENRFVLVLVSDDAALVPLVMRTAGASTISASLRTTRACTGAGEPICRDYR
ncbi:MAG: DUF3108 domain-containing protein [Pseudomonadota bacterium]